MSIDNLYQEIILEHYRHPQGKGISLENGVEVHHVNPSCGDEITLRVAIMDEKVGVSYHNTGCSISQASASMMWELVHGKPATEVLALEAEFLALMQSKGQGTDEDESLSDAIAFVGVSQFPARVKCALLPWMALKDALLQNLRSNNE
jgi:nitrogen fixation NifU-like protein